VLHADVPCAICLPEGLSARETGGEAWISEAVR
jgi:hypothetical protein